MTLLTEKEKQLLKESASNMSPHAFQRLKLYERRTYWETLDRAILSVMQMHPDAFNAKAIKDMEDKLKNKQSYARS